MDFWLIAAAIASTAITVSKTLIFKSFREKAPRPLKKLLQCPYCLTHWLSFFAVSILLPWADYLELTVNVMAMVAVSSIVAFPILLYLKALDETVTK